MTSLPSSSTMTTVLGVTTVVTFLGSDSGSTVTTNSSLFSSILSLLIVTLKEALVVPAEKVALYGPDT